MNRRDRNYVGGMADDLLDSLEQMSQNFGTIVREGLERVVKEVKPSAIEGRWTSQGAQHEHDMPEPLALGKQNAVAGWEWTCGCGSKFTLKAYSTTVAKWTDEQGREVPATAISPAKG